MRRKALFWTAGLLAPLMVVALPMLMVVAMLATTGGDDDEAADDSPSACTEAVSDSTETGPAQTTGSDQLANGLKVAQAFADAGYTKESTAGVIANLVAESGIDPTRGEDGGSGYGIAQWTPKGKLQAKMDGMGIGGENMDSIDTQVKVLVHYAKGDFNNNYLGTMRSEHPDWVIDDDLYKSWYAATSPQAAALAWMAGWERPDWAKSHKETRIQTAVDWYRNKLDGISFQTSPTADKDAGAVTDGGAEGTTDGKVVQASCKSEDGGRADGGQTNGGEGIGDAPVGESDFGWLCKALEDKYKRDVCVEGTTQLVGGNGGFNGVTSDYGWQCVLYAWLRAYLVYGDKGWTPITGGSCGSGGHIAECAAGDPAWNASSTPHAGDLVSSYCAPFGGCDPGHIAFVEEVQEGAQYGGWRIRISEGNYHSDGRWAGYNGRWLTASQLSKQLADGKKPFISNKAWKK